ncbi:MAG TPA: hypothetical protein PKW49_04195 [Paludibacteraceae bacterium]|nr:hypothetical protein [Paludibacteraceae bacterium]
MSRQSETRSDTVVRYVDKVKTDSCYIYERDSVRVDIAGDTVRIDRYIYRYRDRFKTDTLIRGDTVRVCDYRNKIITKKEIETGTGNIAKWFAILLLILGGFVSWKIAKWRYGK